MRFWIAALFMGWVATRIGVFDEETQQGYEEGMKIGHLRGVVDGIDVGRLHGFDEGFLVGYDDGFIDGIQKGIGCKSNAYECYSKLF